MGTTRLYTRTGDRGETGLAGGLRVAKESPRIRAYGTLDEVGAHLGWVEGELPEALADARTVIHRLEHELFVAQAELARAPHLPPPEHRIDSRHVAALEADIDRFSEPVGPLKSFVLERGSRPAAALHIARTVSRRAERELWALQRIEPIRPEILVWVNRLSDLLFALALYANLRLGVPEEPPDYTV